MLITGWPAALAVAGIAALTLLCIAVFATIAWVVMSAIDRYDVSGWWLVAPVALLLVIGFTIAGYFIGLKV